MRRLYLICGILIASLAIAAICQGYQAVPGEITTAPGIPAAPAPRSVNEVLDRLEALKARREAIEREEKALVAILRQKLRAQQDRIGKLGISTSSVEAVPPHTGPVPPPPPGTSY
jgi:hypothetical protein